MIATFGKRTDLQISQMPSKLLIAYLPAGKNKISTSLLSRAMVSVTDTLPVTLDVPSLLRSRRDPNDDGMKAPEPFGELAPLDGNGGEPSAESSSLGGCKSPIDFAMQDMTSSRKSNSEVDKRQGVGGSVDPECGIATKLKFLVANGRYDSSTAAADESKSPACMSM